MARGPGRPTPNWQGALIGFGLITLLGGCAHTPEWAPWYKAPEKPAAQPEPAPQPEPPAKEEVHRRKPVHHAERRPSPPEQVAMVNPDTLVGLKPSAVTQMLGTPIKTAKEDLSLIWTYTADSCTLRIYFYPDIKTSDFHVLKFSLADADGKTLDADAPCRRKLLALREHDTG